MELAEVVILSFSMVTCVVACSFAYYKSKVQAAIIQQQGIDRRELARGKMGGNDTSPYQQQEWWVPLATELMKNPQIQDMILKKVAPTLIGETQTK